MKFESYQQQKTRHSNELSAFDALFFAFSSKQLEEGKEKIGVKDNSEIVSIGAGGFVRKDKVKDFIALMNRHEAERKELRKNRKEFINALCYELWNHEYCITGDPTDALEVFDLTMETVDRDILKKAIQQHNKKDEAREEAVPV